MLDFILRTIKRLFHIHTWKYMGMFYDKEFVNLASSCGPEIKVSLYKAYECESCGDRNYVKIMSTIDVSGCGRIETKIQDKGYVSYLDFELEHAEKGVR